MHGNGRNIRAVLAQPLDVEYAEIVIADRAHDATGLAELGDLIDEDRRGAGGERTDQRDGGAEAVAGLDRHDLDDDLADGNDLLHAHVRTALLRTSSQTAMRMTRPLTMSW